MSNRTRRFLTVLTALVLLLAIGLSAGACHKKDKAADTVSVTAAEEKKGLLESLLDRDDKKENTTSPNEKTTEAQKTSEKEKITTVGASNVQSTTQEATTVSGGLFQVSEDYKKSHSYCVAVNTAQNVVIVYQKGADGNYNVPVKAMACSCGRAGHETPSGQYSILAKQRWLYLIDGSYGQYCSKFKEHYWFHSVPYYSQDPSNLEYDEYNKLGNNASAGCVRMCVRDVKWVYDNLSAGTVVRVYRSTQAEPLAKPASVRIDTSDSNANRGWDPTDPDPANPYNS
ncbi:MAG: L,D-transpeptidase [Clostridia bacterium]|nr:L,D-transpeptidase [Clostridia bacterium]